MVKRAMGLVLACAAMMLSGCAAVGAGAAIEAIDDHVEGPAIAALEAAVAGKFGAAIDQLGAGTSDAEAVALAQGARDARAQLELARFAYDVTIAADAPPHVQRQVETARMQTDAVFEELAQRLAERLAAMAPS